MRSNILALAAAASLGLGMTAFAQDAHNTDEHAGHHMPFVADPVAGKANYDSTCRSCHSGSSTARAPALKGVVGRRIANVKGFEYSDALKAKSRERWTDENLDAYLAKPTTFAPGTKMTIWEDNPQARASIIAYLKTLK